MKKMIAIWVLKRLARWQERVSQRWEYQAKEERKEYLVAKEKNDLITCYDWRYVSNLHYDRAIIHLRISVEVMKYAVLLAKERYDEI